MKRDSRGGLSRRRFGRSALAVALAGTGWASASPVGPALDRPSMMTPRAVGATLQSAARAGGRIVAVGERGVILLSDDGGAKWRQVPAPTSAGLTAVRFVGDRAGWAVGHGGVVLSTTDAGETWQRRFDGVAAAKLQLQAATVSGDAKAVAEAQRMVEEGADKPLLDLYFQDERHGWVIGAYNAAFVTEDGGATWQSVSSRLDNPKALHLYAMRARGDSLLIVGEQGLLLLSWDRGLTFRRLPSPYRGSFFTGEIRSEQEFLVAGLKGNVWRTLDGGATWKALSGGVPVSVTASAVNGAGDVLLASQAGVLLAANDDSLSVVARQLKLPNGLLWLEGDEWLVLGFEGPVVVKIGAVR